MNNNGGGIRPTRDFSFRARLEAGATKEDLMKYYCISEAQYNKTIACLESIRPIQIKNMNKQQEVK